ncbi:Inosine/uridine-preferring nucleoside hydrolase [Ketogulonicigenium robustum]|uniref:Inosine/uridine-preferring nucleoside hydrolase n=1 Tax=Ketogulonicigenium robustum TaxID=92947 RepID=A0A1W6NWA1_9RHOB|nr:nucleoside hydrolase [Ketogulonicigenium robustum]ARO13400.1 Inosine/uridine-preferring nucleoside hydrolase [Ketogulonicigenium robustum]
MRRIILDVDTGIDDALAILYALRRPGISLEAVTTTYGNIDIAQATRNSLQILEAAGRTDIPVARGAARALVRPYTKKGSVIHGANGFGGIKLPEQKAEPVARFAPDFIIDLVRAHPGEITLVPVGPLTNIALALMRAPDLAEKLAGIVFMGGTIHHPGTPSMPSPMAEVNIFNDPEAARTVIASGALLTMIGLDVTMTTKLTEEMIARMAKRADAANDLAGRVTMEAARAYLNAYQRQYPGITYCALHDPLAVAVAEDPSLVTLQPMKLDVECVGEITRGQIIPDLRKVAGVVPNTSVAMLVDAPTFEARFEAALGG